MLRKDAGTRVSLTAALPDEQMVIENLLGLYHYDLSEFNGKDPRLKGTFEWEWPTWRDWLHDYWTPRGAAEGRVPLLIRVDDKLAGFVLKNGWSALRLPETQHTVSEFFVLRKWRRQGVATQVALELFRRYPGRWEIAQERTNLPAQCFWRGLIGGVTGGRFREVDSRPPGWDGPVQLFEV